jgi:pyruvate formate lyase activating enzyme
MTKCIICGSEGVSNLLSLCLDCIRRGDPSITEKAHAFARRSFALPPKPPKTEGGVRCNLCSNECRMREGENGKLRSSVSSCAALVYTYLDPLPTNCCAAWFCPESSKQGYNLATFFYGCNFDCLFCQNPSHKNIDDAPRITIDEFTAKIIPDHRIHCICYFGGSPEPQLPFAIKASARVVIGDI